jgi:hypothetical protein
MSNSNSSDKSSVPTAILVARRAAPKPAPKSKPVFDINIPWIKVAIGGTIGFQAVLAVMALFYLARGERQQFDDDFLDRQPVKVEKALAKVEKPIVEAKEEEPKAKVVAKNDDFEDAPLINDDIVECARIGTDVRFMKDPAAAFLRARAEKKMVFIVHLSGNLEDKEFT